MTLIKNCKKNVICNGRKGTSMSDMLRHHRFLDALETGDYLQISPLCHFNPSLFTFSYQIIKRRRNQAIPFRGTHPIPRGNCEIYCTNEVHIYVINSIV